jgi:hypothetical protein
MKSELLSRIFDHVENGDVDKAVRASLRLSRQIGDYINTALFLRDLIDDTSEIFRVLSDDTSHLKENSQKYIWDHSYTRWLAYRTLPFAASIDNDTGQSKNILVISVGEFPEELKQCEKSIADMAIPPTMGEYDSASFTDRYDVVKSHLRLRIKAINTIKNRVLNRCLNFAIGVERQLAAQEKSVSFLQTAQNDVQNYFKSRSDDVYEKLQKANQLVDSGSPEDLSLLLTQIRRAIKASADYFMPPETSPRKCTDGEIRTLGEEKYLNRLSEFVFSKFPSSTSNDLLRAELQYLLVFARRLNDISSKGVHSKVTSAEAKQGFLGLYLFLFNILQRIELADA